jgi:hypothetical protein
MRIKLNLLLPGVSDDMMRQHIDMKINQTFPAFSNQVILVDMEVTIRFLFIFFV